MRRSIIGSALIAGLLMLEISGCGGGSTGGGSGQPQTNPMPNITSLAPSSALVGSAAQTLTITGTNFISSSAVTYNGTAHSATFVNAGQLTISLSASDLATAGTDAVVVTNPAPGGGMSNSVNFDVDNPKPEITSLAPSSALVGSGAQTLTINGANFVSSSSVNFNNTAHTATFVGASQLTISLSAGDLTTAGTDTVVVSNPEPGGGMSSAATFDVNNPTPVITSLSPMKTDAGSATLTITVTGMNFLNASIVQLSGAALTTSFVSATELTALVPTSALQTGGDFPVTVLSPDAPLSNSVNLEVDNLQPTLSAVAPAVVAAGSPGTSVTVTGTNFVSTSQVLVSGNLVPTTLVSSSQLTANVPANSLATAATLQITVSNPSPGGGESGTIQLAVVGVASLAILAVPESSGEGSGDWFISAGAIDSNGNPVVGLPITFSASAGTLSAPGGTTDSNGAYTTILTPPSGSNASAVAVVSAVTGGQTATAVLSFTATQSSIQRAVGPKVRDRSPFPKRNSRSEAASLDAATYYPYQFSVGGAGSPGSTNVFAASADPACYSSALLSGEETTPANCTAVYSSDKTSITLTNLQTEACKLDSFVSDAEGAISCVGVGAIPVACALGTPETAGLDDVVCAGIITSQEPGLITTCVEFLVHLFARSQLVDLVLGLSDYQVDIAECATSDISSCVNAGLDVVGLYCDAPSTQSSANPICPPASTCVYVLNSGNNTMSVFDTSGNALTVPSGAFPNLSVPDGFAYDPKTGYLYVTNTSSKTVTTYDLGGNQVVLPNAFSNLASSGDPEDVTYDAFNDEFFVNDATGNQIYVYDGSGNPITLQSGSFANINGPYGVVWNPANDTIYVSNDGTDMITAYNAVGTEITLTGSFPGLAAPDDFIVDPVNGNMYVTEAAEGEFGLCAISAIVEYDLNGNPITPSGGFTTVNCPDSIAFLGTSGVGAPELLYVTNIFGNSVTVYDQDGNDITAQVAPGGFPGLSQPTGIVIVTTPPSAAGSATPIEQVTVPHNRPVASPAHRP